MHLCNDNVPHLQSCVARGKVVNRVYDSFNGDYAVNDSGFLRSDFSTLMQEEDKYALALALSRMQSYTEESDVNANKSFEEIVREIRPRWCQSPAELDRFEQYCIDNALDFYKKLKHDTDPEVKEAVGAAMKHADPAPPSES